VRWGTAMPHLHLKPEARRRLYALPPKHREAVFEMLDELGASGRLGKPLANDLDGAYRLARGPFRLVVQPAGVAVVVLRIQHRDEVYQPR